MRDRRREVVRGERKGEGDRKRGERLVIGEGDRQVERKRERERGAERRERGPERRERGESNWGRKTVYEKRKEAEREKDRERQREGEREREREGER